MKRLLVSLLMLAAVGSLHAAEVKMLNSLPEDKFRAAGLHKLTPEELATLEALLPELRTADAPKHAAEPKGPGWFRALVTLQDVAAKPEAAEALESELMGNYTGWTGKTLFRLQNGQVWQQIDGSTRVDSARPSPKVKIYPGVLGAYWLEVEGIKQRVKVKPIKLQ